MKNPLYEALGGTNNNCLWLQSEVPMEQVNDSKREEIEEQVLKSRKAKPCSCMLQKI